MNVHTRLLVDDYEGCFRFYRDVLGLEVSFGDENSGYADFAAGDSSFSLFIRAAMEEVVGVLPDLAPGVERDRVVLVVGVDDLEATVLRLERKGANFALGIQSRPDWGIRTAHLRDPDGNLVELNVQLPHEQWSDDLREEAHGVEGDAG
jgi:lactoylglutathione lyase